MKKILFIVAILTLFSCSDDDEQKRLMYDITYSVTALNSTINKIEYLNNQGNLIELTNVTSPWSINLTVRAGLGLQAAAYGDISYPGSLSITATWKPEGGSTETETVTLPNDTPNSVINNGMVEISGRTLPD